MKILYSPNDFQINQEVFFKMSGQEKRIISAIQVRPHADGGLQWVYEVTYWNGSTIATVWCSHYDIVKAKKPTPPKAE